MTAEFDKLVAGGPGPVGDYCRRIKADGSSSTPMTQQQLKESGAGFWADMARQGGTVIGGGGGGGGLLSGLSWTAGAVTTLSVAGGRARCTSTTPATPARIIKGPFALISGHTYTFSGGNAYGATCPFNIIRVSDKADVSTGDFYSISFGLGATQVMTGLTFTPAGSNPLSYFGLIVVQDNTGQYNEIDDLIDIMP